MNTIVEGNVAKQLAYPTSHLRLVKREDLHSSSEARVPTRDVHECNTLPSRKSSISLTRGQLVLALLTVMTTFIIMMSSIVFHEISIEASKSSAAMTTLTVVQGDSLWAIASAHPIDGLTTQETVNYISEYNELESTSKLMPGMTLQVPETLKREA